MTTAQDRLVSLVRTSIAPGLRERGYRGSGQSFHRRFDGHWGVVSVQRSQWGSRDLTTFAINLGVASDVVLAGRGDDPASAPVESACQWRARLGQLVDGRDTWWEVGSDADDAMLAVLGDTVWGALETVGLPAIEAHANGDAILAAVLDPREAAGAGFGGVDAAGLLLHHHGASDTQRERFGWMVKDARAARRALADEPRPKMGPSRTRSALVDLGHTNPDKRVEAAYLLGGAKVPGDVVPALRAALNDPVERVRVMAAASLAGLGDDASLDRLLRFVRESPHRHGLGDLADGLARLALRRPEHRPAIIAALEQRLATATGIDLVGVGVALERLGDRDPADGDGS